MWKYIKHYIHFALIAAVLMVGEVMMDLLQPSIMSRIVDDGVLGVCTNGVGSMELIGKLGIRMIVLVLFGGICGSLNNVFVHIAGQNIGNDIRKDCFRSIMTFSFPQVEKFGTGSLVTRVTNDITQVQNFLSMFVRGMIRTFLLMFGSIFFMFRLDRQFGQIVLCAFPFIVGCLLFCLGRANPLFSRLQEQLDQINEIMQEDVSGIRMIKSCVRETYEKIRFGKANDALVGTQLHVLTIFAFMNPVMNALMYVVVTMILLTGSVRVDNGMTTPGSIMAAITYTTQLLNGILMLVMLFQNISRGIASWRRLREILVSTPQLMDGDIRETPDQHGEIEFRDVSFSYPGSSQVVLKHMNLTIHSGETVAVMGATGCGKSTLASLIPRFYDADTGTVLVDGMDVRLYEQKALRSKIAIALQKSELFSRSVADNISWGRPDAGDTDIWKAAETAQADGFIRRMPEGYESLVAERGMSLSGGQKQRLSISRAIMKKAEILILDDSTSALDLKTEAELYEALKRTAPESTKIMIAQRIASVRHADRIIVLEQGEIEACGTHEELMKSSKVYRDIYDSQMGEEGEAIG